MNNDIVLDIETQNTFADIGSRKDLSKLKVSLVGVYSYAEDKYLSFLEDELQNLWPLLENAGKIIGYNSKYFDIPVLNSYYSGDLMTVPQLDLFEIIENSSGKRLKLDHIAKGTLNEQKLGTGLDAIKYWKEGKIDKLRKYCIADVKITKEEYGQIKHVELNLSNDSISEQINLTFKMLGDGMEHTMEQMISAFANYDEQLLIKTLSDYANLEVK